MEKIEKAFSKNYPVLRLFKEDIEELINVFQQKYEQIEIIAEGYKLDSILEIEEIRKKEIVDFKISAHRPCIYLELSGFAATLYMSDEDDIALLGLAAKIEKILLRRKRWLRYLTSNWMLVTFIVLPWAVDLFLPTQQYKTQGIVLTVFMLCLLAIYLPWSWKTSLKRHSLIYWFDSQSSPGFFKKNKESVLVAIISAVITALITAVVSRLAR